MSRDNLVCLYPIVPFDQRRASSVHTTHDNVHLPVVVNVANDASTLVHKDALPRKKSPSVARRDGEPHFSASVAQRPVADSPQRSTEDVPHEPTKGRLLYRHGRGDDEDRLQQGVVGRPRSQRKGLEDEVPKVGREHRVCVGIGGLN